MREERSYWLALMIADTAAAGVVTDAAYLPKEELMNNQDNAALLIDDLLRALKELTNHDYAEQCQECGIGQSEAWRNAKSVIMRVELTAHERHKYPSRRMPRVSKPQPRIQPPPPAKMG